MSENIKGVVGNKITTLSGNTVIKRLGLSGNVRMGGGSGVTDYEKLQNLPSLNGVTLKGMMVSEDLYLPKVMINDTEHWNEVAGEISEKDTFYIYTDYVETPDGRYIAGVKVGDGLGPIGTLPFIDTIMQEHMSNTDIHVTPEEKEFWNNKHRGFVYGETLVLTKD